MIQTISTALANRYGKGDPDAGLLRRIVSNRGVKVNGSIVTNPDFEVNDGDEIEVKSLGDLWVIR